MADIAISSIADFKNANDPTARYYLTTDLNFGNTSAYFGENFGGLFSGFMFDGMGYTLSNIDNTNEPNHIFDMQFLQNTKFNTIKTQSFVAGNFREIYNLEFYFVEMFGELGLLEPFQQTSLIKNVLVNGAVYNTNTTIPPTSVSTLFGSYIINAFPQTELQQDLIIENIEILDSVLHPDSSFKGYICGYAILNNFDITVRNIKISSTPITDNGVSQHFMGMVFGQIEERTGYTGKLNIEKCLLRSNNMVQFYGASAMVIGNLFKNNNVAHTSNTTIRDCLVYTDRFISSISASFPKNGKLYDRLPSVGYSVTPTLINNYGYAGMRNTDNFNFDVLWRYSAIGSTFPAYNSLTNDTTYYDLVGFDFVNTWEKSENELANIKIPTITPPGLQNTYVKVNGVWKGATNGYVKVNGVWKEMIEAFINR